MTTLSVPITCKACALWKMRWRDGSGVCWHQNGQPRHADEAICEAFTRKVIVVEPKV